ncbi:MT-A70 family methyltransferase [Dehalococcoidia bacterium]|nr:MT-A70 family methyltransferase [Dehalococcoidia bacterium]
MRIRKADPKVLKIHPLAHLIPDMRGSEWQEFYTDIVMRGIKVPLEVLADGTVVDGRHRLRAAIELGMKEVPIVDAPLSGDSPEVYMLKAAVLRRHLTDDQRAALAALWREENRRQGERSDLTSAGRSAEVKDTKPITRVQATEFFKVSRWKIDQASKILHSSPEKFQQVHRGNVKLNAAYRDVKKAEARSHVTDLPAGKYQVIYADPPWQYDNTGVGGSAESHYPTMSMNELARLDVASLTGEYAVLFLWVTGPFLPEGLELCQAWGFEYKTTFVWIKDRPTYGKLGFYNYGQHEFLFVATRGSCLPQSGTLEPSVLFAPKGKHSEKPEAVYELIEQMYSGPYIELFARKTRPNWAAWGT